MCSSRRRFPRHQRRSSASCKPVVTLARVLRDFGSTRMSNKGVRPAASVDPMFASYEQLAGSLLKNLSGVCLLESDLSSRGQTSTLKPEALTKWLRALRWDSVHDRTPAGVAYGRGQWLSAIPLEQSDGSLLGAFCVRQSLANLPAQPARLEGRSVVIVCAADHAIAEPQPTRWI
jgi:hypothetical protein